MWLQMWLCDCNYVFKKWQKNQPFQVQRLRQDKKKMQSNDTIEWYTRRSKSCDDKGTQRLKAIQIISEMIAVVNEESALFLWKCLKTGYYGQWIVENVLALWGSTFTNTENNKINKWQVWIWIICFHSETLKRKIFLTVKRTVKVGPYPHHTRWKK